MRIFNYTLTGVFSILFALNCQGQAGRVEHSADTAKTEQVRFILAEGTYVGVDRRILRPRTPLNAQNGKEAILIERRVKIKDGSDVTVGSAHRLKRKVGVSAPATKKGDKVNGDQSRRFILQQGMDVGVGPRKEKMKNGQQ